MGIAVDRIATLLARFLQVIGQEMSSSSAHLRLFSPDGRAFYQRSWPVQASSAGREETGIIHRAVEEKRPLLVELEAEKQSFLCLPFYSRNRPVGALCLGRDACLKPFGPEDLEFFVFLAQSMHPFIFGFLDRHDQPQEHASDSPAGREFETIIGQSRAFSLVQSLIEKIKDTDAPVFISGESGTGKELIARAIHDRGRRKSGPFVPVNCGAIPDQLLESEIFGHARGAFTGAWRDKAGLIEEADKGTFFLDEIGDLSLPLQAKLLRLLQEKEIRRIGETRTRRVDVRFVSATNKDLEREIEQGRFRVDLYYRLRILTIEVPPLRERKGDLLLLLNHFVEKYCREMRIERAHFSPAALELMLDYSWPGNIRELQNEVQRCLVLAAGEGLIKEEHLSAKINPRKGVASPASFNYFEARSAFEKRFLNQALLRSGYNKARTAGEIGLSRQGLFKLLKKHRLSGKPGDGIS